MPHLGPLGRSMAEYFGAVPTVVPPGEIYTLLERKGVDAVEWAPPSANLPEGFHEAAQYIIVPGVHQPTFLWEVVMNQETWDALPEELKPLVEAAAELTTLQSTYNFYHHDMEAMEQYRSGRNEVITLDPAFTEELSAAGRDWIAQKAEAEAQAGNERRAEILADYTAFQDRWAAESGYLIRNEN